MLAQKGSLIIEERLDLNVEESEVYTIIKTYVEKNLFSWEKFPLDLPGPSIVDVPFNYEKKEEEEVVGGVIVMGHNQMEAVKRRGKFQLNEEWYRMWLHSGTEVLRDEFLDNISFSLRFILVWISRIISGGSQFNIKDAIKGIWKGVVRIIDLIFGLVRRKVDSVENRIQNERGKFLVAELRVWPDQESGCISDVGRYVRQQMEKAKVEHVMTLGMSRPPPVPYTFCTPSTLDNEEFVIDLRLFDRSIFGRCCLKVREILEDKSYRCDRWFMAEREKIIKELNEEKNVDELEFQGNLKVMDRYWDRIKFAVIDGGGGFGYLLEQQARSWILMRRAIDMYDLRLKRMCNLLTKELRGDCPLLSRDKVWLEDKLEKGKVDFIQKNKWMAHEICADLLAKEGLNQSLYFLKRDWAFLRERCSVLRNELMARDLSNDPPCRVFEWELMVANKGGCIKTGTGVVCWRWLNVLMRTLCLLLKSLNCLLIYLPWDSKLSIRSLMLMDRYEIRSGFNPTVAFKLRELWRNVGKRLRSNFTLNLIRGILYSFLYALVWPIGCFISWGVGLGLALTSFFWVPLGSVLYYMVCILIYDFDSPNDYRLCPLLRILLGISCDLIGILGGLALVLLCPVFTIFSIFGSVGIYLSKLVFDRMVMFVFVKFQMADFILKIQEDEDEFTEISALESLVLVRVCLEEDELNYWKENVLLKLREPLKRYEDFSLKILLPFGVKLVESGCYKGLVRDFNLYSLQLDEIEKGRRLGLGGIKCRVGSKGMKVKEIKYVLEKGRSLIKFFYTTRVFRFLENVDLFWENKGLDIGDWTGLTYLLFSQLFGFNFLCNEGIKGEEVIKGEELINLLIINQETCSDMVALSSVDYKIHSPYIGFEAFNPFLQVLGELEVAEGNRYVAVWHRRGMELPSSIPRLWQTGLCIPLPILHPVYISLLIYNRDETDHPYDIETPLCQAIIKSIIAVQDSCLHRDCISLSIESESSEDGCDSTLEFSQENEIHLENSLVSSRFFIGTSV